jgi:hypothetical protein
LLPISPSNPSSADLYSVLHLEELVSEVERERAALMARPVIGPTARARGARLLRPRRLDGLAARLGVLSRLGRGPVPSDAGLETPR